MYTHYWYRQPAVEITDKQWKSLCGFFYESKRQLHQEGIELVFEDDDLRPPFVTDTMIRFNGVGDDGHETMLLYRGTDDARPGFDDTDRGIFHFCKTARKPYDVAVSALLLAAQHYAPGAWRISSDGDREEAEWQAGIALFEKIAGVKAPTIDDWETE